eukprot:TRINITY_DN18530_c0_g1_i1.p1 TRINITY_DN18530_c0_g1~~TRINITY_DN18530_c0_g1_i1.p1  ORF type:complete len:377 (-),score=100.97 TRINITY_DN18530_c0_g1_i1:51-1181(-)
MLQDCEDNIDEGGEENVQEVVVTSRLDTNPYAQSKTPRFVTVYASTLPPAARPAMHSLNALLQTIRTETTYDPDLNATTWVDPERLMRRVPTPDKYDPDNALWDFTPSLFTIDLHRRAVTSITHIEHLPPGAYPLVAQAFNALIPLFQRAGLLPPPSASPRVQQFPVVLKAKTLLLQPHSAYTGVWHQEGQGSQVSGVGLLYPVLSPSLSPARLLFRPRFVSYYFASPNYTYDLDDGSVLLEEGRTIVFSNSEVVHKVGEVRNESGEAAERSFVGFFLCNRSGDWKGMCLGGCVCVRRNAVLLRRVLQLGEGFPLHVVEGIVELAEWNGVVKEEEKMENLRLWKKYRARSIERATGVGWNGEPWCPLDGGVMRFYG